MMNFGEIFIATAEAQQTATNAKGPAGMAGLLMPMLLVFAIFYFLMIRPQQKQQKQHRELLGNLKKGDDVISAAGIHGKIAGIADNVVTLEIAENVRIKLEKSQVASVKSAS